MAYNSNEIDPRIDFIDAVVQDKLRNQPPVKKYANTITAVYGVAITIIGQLLGQGFELPDWALWVVLALTLGGTVFGVSRTPNGFSTSQQEKLEQWMQEYIDVHRNDGGPANDAAFEG